MAQSLRGAGISATVEPDADSLISHLTACGSVIVTAEALEPLVIDGLIRKLREQPAWSDIPIIVLCARSTPAAFDECVRALGNVTVVQRPLAPASLISVVQSAIRARSRQFQIRGLLEESSLQNSHIEALNERLQRAMTETHHRVKNNLQIIAAMVDMRVMESNGSVPVEEVKRIALLTQSLAMVHDILTNQAKKDGEAHSVSARAVMEKLVGMLQIATPHRPITLNAQDVRLTSRQGTSLALVLSELVGNAIKHGRGSVDIAFKASEAVCELTVCDQGDGFPADFDPQRSANTGLELIYNLAHWDLAGDVDYRNHPEGGACVQVTLPLAEHLTIPSVAA